jgi:hypothetical protein
LKHLVGFGFRVGQAPARQGAPGQVLQPVAHVEQMPAAAPQLTRQARRRGPLGDAADEQHQGGGPALGALQGGASPGVEDPATGAAVVQDRVAVGAVDGQVPAAAGGTAKAAGVQGVGQEVVARLLVEQVHEGEVHVKPSIRIPAPGVLSRAS